MSILKKSQGKLLILSFLGFIIFFIITFLMLADISYTNKIESNLTKWNQSTFGYPNLTYNNYFLHNLIVFCAKSGYVFPTTIIVIIISVFLILEKQFMLSSWFIGTMLCGGIVSVGLKLIFKRPRPTAHLINDISYSFPSGHSLISTLLIGSIIFLVLVFIPSYQLKIFIIPLLILFWLGILFSRIYFNAHYLLDVLGGVSIGLGILFFAIYLLSTLNATYHK